MTKTSKLSIDQTKNNSFLGLLKGAFWAISTSLVCVLIFAFIIKFTSINESLISPINQGIKILSILIGCFIASKKINSNGWLWGLLLGAIYTILAFVIFSILDGEFNFNLSLLNDITFGSILGLISGIIAFAIKK